MLDCLRSCFCSEFQACTCNLCYIKTPYLEKPEKDVPLSFLHGAYLADGIMVARQELKAREGVQENNSVFLKCSKTHMKYSGICISKHEERASTNGLIFVRQPLFFYIF